MDNFSIQLTDESLQHYINNDPVLIQLKMNSERHFNLDILNDIKSLYNNNTFTLDDLFKLHKISELSVIQNLSINELVQNLNFDAYCRFLAKYINTSKLGIKNKLLYLLSLKFTLPNELKSTFDIKHVKVMLNSKYKPKKESLSLKSDILVDVNTHLTDLLQNVKFKTFEPKYDEFIPIKFTGPILENVIIEMITLQNSILQINKKFSINVKPFIKILDISNKE